MSKKEEKKLKIGFPAPENDTKNYYNALTKLGAECVEVFPDSDFSEIDGLLIPGGVDIDPKRYGQENIACGTINEELDEREFATLRRFMETGKPVFGICRGLQLINVYFGGTLIQHLPAAADHAREAEHLSDKGNAFDKVHCARPVDGTFVFQLYGSEFNINSAHHQAIDKLGDGLQIQMFAPDGTIEAIRHESLPVFALQWHPERMTDPLPRKDTVNGGLVLKFFLLECKKVRDGVTAEKEA